MKDGGGADEVPAANNIVSIVVIEFGVTFGGTERGVVHSTKT
jgi:hypothetical protein